MWIVGFLSKKPPQKQQRFVDDQPGYKLRGESKEKEKKYHREPK
jgi:hypothetical protein